MTEFPLDAKPEGGVMDNMALARASARAFRQSQERINAAENKLQSLRDQYTAELKNADDELIRQFSELPEGIVTSEEIEITRNNLRLKILEEYAIEIRRFMDTQLSDSLHSRRAQEVITELLSPNGRDLN